MRLHKTVDDAYYMDFHCYFTEIFFRICLIQLDLLEWNNWMHMYVQKLVLFIWQQLLLKMYQKLQSKRRYVASML